MRAVIGSIVVILGLAAGCMAPAESATSATSSAGNGSSPFEIRVTDEPGGPPLAGASVSVHAKSSSFFGDESQQDIEMVTDAQGAAEAHVDPASTLDVVVSLDGHTTETKRVEAAGQRGSLVVPLYLSRVTLEITDTLGPGDASLHRTGVGSFHWSPHELRFGRNDEARRGYAERIVLLNFTLDWQNTPTAMGDLGIATGRTTDRADVVQDADAHQLPPGAYQEKMSMALSDMRKAHWEGASTLFAGAGTGTAYVAPQGLPYTLKVDATFDGAQALRTSPGFNQVWGALAALAGVALVLGRRA